MKITFCSGKESLALIPEKIKNGPNCGHHFNCYTTVHAEDYKTAQKEAINDIRKICRKYARQHNFSHVCEVKCSGNFETTKETDTVKYHLDIEYIGW